jgi:O-phospho-L-seryl-tRNASec:L-selenocysteinyl-tRNA synthase
VNEAARVGRLDAFVSSTDKNFLVPVGGALVAGPSASVIDAVSASYPGRASASPILDLFITLLGMGQSGLKGLLAQRKAVFAALKERLTTVAAEAGEHLLSSPANPISLALSLNTLVALGGGRATYLGSMLFSRGVSGTRVISPSDEPSRRIDGHTFAGYGTSLDDYPHTYLTAAAAMGMTLADVEAYASRLERTLREYRKQRTPSPSGSLLMAGGADGQPELAAAEMGEGNEQASGR